MSTRCQDSSAVQVLGLLAQYENFKQIVRVIDGRQGFKIIMMTRLTPVPFGLQNALFSVRVHACGPGGRAGSCGVCVCVCVCVCVVYSLMSHVMQAGNVSMRRYSLATFLGLLPTQVSAPYASREGCVQIVSISSPCP